MSRPSVMALFCEDIREEKGDTITLVGLLPDILSIASPGAPGPPEAPKLLTRLSIYIRINFDPNMELKIGSVTMVVSDTETIPLGVVEHSLIQKAKSDALAKGSALAGIVLRIAMTGFSPPENGTAKVNVEINDEAYLAGALRFQPVENNTAKVD